MPSESAVYFHALPGVEALHASFVKHAYRPHSHPTWTVAVMERGAAAFELERTRQRAGDDELFVLEPDAVHTGMAAVPQGWAYKVLYLEPELISAWAEADAGPPRAARWVVFRDRGLRAALLRAHAALMDTGDAARRAGGDGAGDLAVEAAVVEAVDALRPHLRPAPARAARDRPEHAAVRRARVYLSEHWNERVPLAALAEASGLSRFELVRRFSAQVGQPPHAFQLDLRVARARRMLSAGTAAAEVAFACGFADQAHLTRVFKAAVGVPPGNYGRATATSFKTAVGSSGMLATWPSPTSRPRSPWSSATTSPSGSASTSARS